MPDIHYYADKPNHGGCLTFESFYAKNHDQITRACYMNGFDSYSHWSGWPILMGANEGWEIINNSVLLFKHAPAIHGVSEHWCIPLSRDPKKVANGISIAAKMYNHPVDSVPLVLAMAHGLKYKLQEGSADLDYGVYTHKVEMMIGKRLAKRRSIAKRYIDDNIKVVQQAESPGSKVTQLLDRWKMQKEAIGAVGHTEAYDKLANCDAYNHLILLHTLVYDGTLLVGYGVVAQLHARRAVVACRISDREYPGMGDFVFQKMAQHVSNAWTTVDEFSDGPAYTTSYEVDPNLQRYKLDFYDPPLTTALVSVEA